MDVDEIHDLDTAKQVIKLQGAELVRLSNRIGELTQRLAQAEGKNEPQQLAMELAQLQERVYPNFRVTARNATSDGQLSLKVNGELV